MTLFEKIAKLRSEPIVKTLGRQHGGKWKYSGYGTWRCDDGRRFAHWVSNGVDESDNPTGMSLYVYSDEGSVRVDLLRIYDQAREIYDQARFCCGWVKCPCSTGGFCTRRRGAL